MVKLRREKKKNPSNDTIHTFALCGWLDLLFALMSISLRYWFSQLHLKLVAAQRHLLVVFDQGVKRVKHQVVSQVKLGAAGFLTRVDSTVLHSA